MLNVRSYRLYTRNELLVSDLVNQSPKSSLVKSKTNEEVGRVFF